MCDASLSRSRVTVRTEGLKIGIRGIDLNCPVMGDVMTEGSFHLGRVVAHDNNSIPANLVQLGRALYYY